MRRLTLPAHAQIRRAQEKEFGNDEFRHDGFIPQAKHSPRCRGQRRRGRTDAHGAAVRRPCAHRGCAGRGQDDAGQRAGAFALLLVQAHSVHAGHHPVGYHGLHHAQPVRRNAVSSRRNHEPDCAGRRNQPHLSENAVRAAGGYGRAAGDGGRRDLSPRAALYGAGDAEPGGFCRHLSPAGSADGPLLHARFSRLSLFAG